MTHVFGGPPFGIRSGIASGTIGLGLTHAGQPANKLEHLHRQCRLFAFGSTPPLALARQ